MSTSVQLSFPKEIFPFTFRAVNCTQCTTHVILSSVLVDHEAKRIANIVSVVFVFHCVSFFSFLCATDLLLALSGFSNKVNDKLDQLSCSIQTHIQNIAPENQEEEGARAL